MPMSNPIIPSIRRVCRVLSLASLTIVLVACAQHAQDLFVLSAVLETEPVASEDDAADDPAIWVHPSDHEASLIIGTDKGYGVEVYDLEGKRKQRIAAGYTNNIDLRPLPSPWAEGSAILAASNRSGNTISLFIMSADGVLSWLPDSEITTGLTEIYGACLYTEGESIYAFVNDKDGRYQQWLLGLEATESATRFTGRGTLVREFRVASQPEGCVADDTHARLFIGVEAEGVYVLDARTNASAEMTLVAPVDGDRLVADVEGLALFEEGGEGLLVVSSQGNNTYAVFNRLPPFSHIGSFALEDSEAYDGRSAVDGTSDTDGIALAAGIRSLHFPEGLFVAQDGSNTLPAARQNFKLVSWQEVRQGLNL